MEKIWRQYVDVVEYVVPEGIRIILHISNCAGPVALMEETPESSSCG